jgi:hypothetical protein
MRSNLNRAEFKRRLADLTSEEKGIYLTTPYDFSKRPFSGTFDDATFLLTRNSVWKHVKAIEISGDIKRLTVTQRR